MNKIISVLLLISVSHFFDVFVAKAHSKSMFSYNSNKFKNHFDNNDITDDEDDDNGHDEHSNIHNDNEQYNGHHNDHHDSPLIKNPSKEVIVGNTISQILSFKQFIVNSMVKLMTRPARNLSFGIHFSKNVKPLTAKSKHGIRYSSDEHRNYDSIKIITDDHHSRKHTTTEAYQYTSAYHQNGFNYHNFATVAENHFVTPRPDFFYDFYPNHVMHPHGY